MSTIQISSSHINKVAELRKLQSALRTLVDDHIHSDRHRSYIAANVKLWGAKSSGTLDDILTDEFVAKEGLTPSMVERIKSELDANRLWENWIDNERDYLVDDYLLGHCCHSSMKWWAEQIQILQETGKSSYPAINELPTIEAKVAMMTEWAENDEKMLERLSYLDKNTIGFFGGWFALDKADQYQEELDKIDSFFEDYPTLDEQGNVTLWSGSIAEDEQEELVDVLYTQIDDLFDSTMLYAQAEAMLFLVSHIEDMAKNMDFHAELEFRIDEVAYELKKAQAVIDDVDANTQGLACALKDKDGNVIAVGLKSVVEHFAKKHGVEMVNIAHLVNEVKE